MKTAKLIFDGKEIEVQISDEQIQELTKPKKVTGFERAELGGTYWYNRRDGDVCIGTEDHMVNDDYNYDCSNYYTDMALAEWCSRNDTLNYKMRRWAAEHNSKTIEWGEKNIERWCLLYNFELQEIMPKPFNRALHPFEIYFSTEEIAEAAIAEFGDEIKWLAQNRPMWF